MYSLKDDGSATVTGVPIAPFVPFQHQQIDVTTVNRLANYSLRVARERGWLQAAEDVSMATDFYESNDARPLVEQEGYAPKGEDLTMFYAGVEATLADNQPHFRYPPIPSTMLLHVHFYVCHVGNSSYSLYAELSMYTDGKEGAALRPLGQFRVTAVTVSKTTRSPAPIPSYRREVLERACRQCAAAMAAARPRVNRLNVPELLQTSRWLQPETAATAHVTLRGPSMVDLPDGSTLYSTYKQKYVLRETDIDFNHHVNQFAMMQLISNTFRRALGDKACVYARLLNGDVRPIVGDLLLRQLRIDYVREIPMSHQAAEVYLFPASKDELGSMMQSQEGKRLGKLVSIGFLMLGAPEAKREERYVAAAGLLSCFI